MPACGVGAAIDIRTRSVRSHLQFVADDANDLGGHVMEVARAHVQADKESRGV